MPAPPAPSPPDRADFVARRAIASVPLLGGGRRSCSFEDPVETIVAWELDQVRPAIARASAAAADGHWAVGFVSFDAGPAFDPAIVALRDSGTPLAAFGVFRRAIDDPGDLGGRFRADGWASTVGQNEFEDGVRAVKERIAAGDTYQVNLTLRLRSAFDGDPLGLFRSLARSQRGDHSVFLDLGSHALCSASPELFFRSTPVGFSNNGVELLSKPMKGTAARHIDPIDDRQAADDLSRSMKNQAENTMIVDMMRNDFGRIARIGSVDVPQLHAIETYPTVHQMISNVTAETDASLVEIFDACFPPASITGAPKVSTCQIITELEADARGVYTGAAGVITPDGQAEFNVAIRSVWVDRSDGNATYGVGGGIIWDSDPTSEWIETRTKTRVLESAPEPFDLFETILWQPGTGPTLLDRHLDRMSHSAERFGFPFDREAAGALLGAVDDVRWLRLRLVLSADGTLDLRQSPIDPSIVDLQSAEPWPVAVASDPVDSGDLFLRHKTTRRTVYEKARDRFPEHGDVILWNERRELTETTIGNLVLEIGGQLFTPPESAGLLPGTFRAELLAHDKIIERVLTLDDLPRATQMFLINGLRGWVTITLG